MDRNVIDFSPPPVFETAEQYVNALDEMGGDLQAYCTRFAPGDLHQRWLFTIYKLLESNPEQRKRWQQLLDRSLQVRLDYLQARTMQKLESWQCSEKNNTADIANAKLVLEELFVGRAEFSKRKAAYPFTRAIAKLNAQAGRKQESSEEADAEPEQSKDLMDDLLDEAG